MLADTIPENPEPIQTTIEKEADTSSTIPSLQLEPLLERHYVYFTIYLVIN